MVDGASAQTTFPAKIEYFVKDYNFNWLSYSPYDTQSGGLFSDPDSAMEPLLSYSSALPGRVYTLIREDRGLYGTQGLTYNLHLVNENYPDGVNILVQVYIGVHFSCPGGFSTSPYDSLCHGPASCPTGSVYDSTQGCAPPPPPPPPCKKNAQGTCQEPNKEPDACASTPMPIHMGTGNKYLLEKDYQAAYKQGLNLTRYFNSQVGDTPGSMGLGWRHQYEHFLLTDSVGGTPAMVMNRADGSTHIFKFNGSTFEKESGYVIDRLLQVKDGNGTATGWAYMVGADDSTEQYNLKGQLVSIKRRDGTLLRLSYTAADKLNMVLDPFGATMTFAYDALGRVRTIRVGGKSFQYAYDANQNLVSATYPDQKSRQYRYNESGYTGGASLPNALTGVIDENNSRYASYFYDAQGRAVNEYLGSGVSQYALTFNADGTTLMSDPLGTARAIQFTSSFNRLKISGQSQPGGAGCGAASSNLSRDANGNPATKTDFRGIVTAYTYDLNRNLETSRIEAAGTSQARKISTIWHPQFRLPVQIDEPLRRTTFTHDTNGNVLSMTEQPTLDATGNSGAGASVTGSPRQTSYTYNSYGQLTSITGPRQDLPEKTTLSYIDANLYSITNAAGHVITMSNFDLDGRPRAITDANDVVTSLVYHPRGWLLSRSVTADGITDTTSYTYDNVGQLTGVTLPDNSRITYTWDAAHRLTRISDQLGNSINYTLDNMGNRIRETVLDATGTLKRQVSRVYDTLNRLQEVTGATQ